jgi:hypothetical protein
MSINHVSDGMTISRLVKRLLNGFAPAGMLLLFSSERAFSSLLALIETAWAQFLGEYAASIRLLSARPQGTMLRLNFDEAAGQNARGACREQRLLGPDMGCLVGRV